MLLKDKQWPKITATGLCVGRVFVLKRKPLSAFKKESFSRTDCWGLESQKTWDLWEMQNDKYFGRWMSCLSTVCHTLCGVFVVSCRNSVFFYLFFAAVLEYLSNLWTILKFKCGLQHTRFCGSDIFVEFNVLFYTYVHVRAHLHKARYRNCTLC